jgi:8-oxo-dGTP diphosphatase
MQPRPEEKPALHEFGTRLAGVDYIERPGIYAVIENNHKQIAVIETRTGYFLPGGGVDPGETEMNALKREIMEEMGCQVSVGAEIGEAVEYLKAHTEKKYYQIHGTFYKVQLDSKIGKGIKEAERLVWLSPGDAVRLLTRQSQVWAVRSMAKEY